jgi:hypothetical protein
MRLLPLAALRRDREQERPCQTNLEETKKQKHKRGTRNLRKTGQKRFGGGQGHRRRSKQNLVGFWSNSDFELSQQINAQNWTYHCSLQKTGSEKFALKLDSF